MFARGNSTTTDRKNTSPCPSALLDARLKMICWNSETCRTSPVAVLEKIGICAARGVRAAGFDGWRSSVLAPPVATPAGRRSATSSVSYLCAYVWKQSARSTSSSS